MTANFFEFQQQLIKPRAGRAAPVGEAKPLSVSELTGKISRLINSGLPGHVLVRGEASNWKPNRSSGHIYFTLKDAEACLHCVMFRSEAARLKFEPGDGMELLADGHVAVYPPNGRYQLNVSSLRPLGQGALELAFQQVRARLQAEGLFAPERKKPIPRYPMNLVLITSREAAALQDILKVLRQFPWLRLRLYAVPVQGDGSAEKIAAAIAHVNAGTDQIGMADVLLLARGGGSLEDLWCFNEEIVARAVTASHIPVVTGIGHEVDVSIADLVADYHAHTPTEAARIITANWVSAGTSLDQTTGRLRHGLRTIVSDARQRLKSIERHEAFRRPLDRIQSLRQLLDERERAMIVAQDRMLRNTRDRVQAATARLERFLPSVLIRTRDVLNVQRQRLDQSISQRLRAGHDRVSRASALLQECHPRSRLRLIAQQLDAAQQRLSLAVELGLRRRGEVLDAVSRQLEAVSPEAVLRRGYTITARKRDGQPVRSAAQLRPGDKLITRFADGQAESTVNDSKQMSLFE